MVTVLIIYYSRTGNTEAMARAVAEGNKIEGVEVVLKRVDYATIFDVFLADAVAFGSPCHFSYMAGAFCLFLRPVLPPVLFFLYFFSIRIS